MEARCLVIDMGNITIHNKVNFGGAVLVGFEHIRLSEGVHRCHIGGI